MTPAQIERRALEIRQQTIIDAPPVDAEAIARLLGIDVQRTDLGEEVSGLLVIEQGIPVIGVNKTHPAERQRFTIAHEVGHFVLHRNDSDLFIDKEDFLAVYRRKDVRAKDNKRERDANTFAGALLMPQDLLHRELDHRRFSMFDDDEWLQLAKRFGVSRQALMIRLTKLGFFGASYI